MAERSRGWFWGIVVVAVIFVARQFIRPAIGNPPATAEIHASPQVKQVLRSRCYQCHSNETKLPWYDQIAPAYWLVAKDVRTARSHLNFSEIGSEPEAAQRGALFESVNMIQMRAMPLPRYLAVHPSAKITPEDVATLRGYLAAPPSTEVAVQAETKLVEDQRAADDQYTKWAQASSTMQTVQPEFNGVEFMPDYHNWRAISSTDRFDNHTMREILGNDVAIKAIAEGRINPWPDGTALAKVAWQQAQADDNGVVRTGSFIQVELMIKDSHRYSSSEGWGWGRWRGADLKPYGKDAGFQNECMSCHEPVAKNDHVYTMPIGGQQ